jgi:hypothetical protein
VLLHTKKACSGFSYKYFTVMEYCSFELFAVLIFGQRDFGYATFPASNIWLVSVKTANMAETRRPS